jgi:hypothetical protein
MEIEVQLEVFESIRTRLKAVKGAYSAQAGNDKYAEIEDLAREAFVSLKRAAQNMAKMVELERKTNEHASTFGSGPEVTACQRLLKAVADLPSIPN